MDWYGNETLHNTPFTNMTIHDTPVAAIQNVDNFSFAYVPLLFVFALTDFTPFSVYDTLELCTKLDTRL